MCVLLVFPFTWGSASLAILFLSCGQNSTNLSSYQVRLPRWSWGGILLTHVCFIQTLSLTTGRSSAPHAVAVREVGLDYYQSPRPEENCQPIMLLQTMFVQGIYITYMLHCRDSPGKTEVNENIHCYNYGLAELAGGFPNGYMGIAPKPLSWSGYYPELSNLAPLGRVFLWSGLLCITAGGPVAGQLCGGGPDQCCQGHMYILSDFRDVHSRIYEHKLDLTCY